MSEFKIYVQGMVLVLVTTLWATAAVSAVTRSEPMLYLVEFHANEAGAPTSPGQVAGLLDQLVISSLERLPTDDSIRAVK